MSAAINFILVVLAVLCLLVYVAERKEKYDAGYVYDKPELLGAPTCWEEPNGCTARSMYPSGY